LSTRAADLVASGNFGVMVAYDHGESVCVPLEDLAGKEKPVPSNHPWINAARHVGTVLGE
jgi:6-phosphofructokinase 1